MSLRCACALVRTNDTCNNDDFILFDKVVHAMQLLISAYLTALVALHVFYFVLCVALPPFRTE